MSFWNAIPLVGDVIDGLFKVIDKGIEDKDKANELKAQLQQAMIQGDLQQYAAELQARASVVLGEVQGQSWLQRNWRPLLMCLFGVIIANNYLVVPIMHTPAAEIPPDMWELLKLGIGGYVVGRSVEKGLEVWKR